MAELKAIRIRTPEEIPRERTAQTLRLSPSGRSRHRTARRVILLEFLALALLIAVTALIL